MLPLALLLQTAFAQTAVDPAEKICITNEPIQLSATAPKSYSAGTVLPSMVRLTNGRIPSPGALDPASVVVRHQGRPLALGKDYLIDPEWATFGVTTGGAVTPQDTVHIDYCFSLRRLDAVVTLPDGARKVIKGESRLTRPEPPPIPAGAKHVANLYIPYFSDGRHPDEYPLLEPARDAVTASTPGRIPKTLAKLRSRQPVKIVSWGDSVTVGGDASRPETRYVAVFEQMLRQRFPQSNLVVETVAVGGTNSRQWLYPEKYTHRLPELAREIRWQRVLDARPDLVTIEFVNDAGMKAEDVRTVYSDILQRLHTIGAEVIFITPHFTRPPMMGFTNLRDKESRVYVHTLRAFANEKNIALADASARWEHLWKEGIPYETLLNNAINHPDDRGHRLFAEELMKCFDKANP